MLKAALEVFNLEEVVSLDILDKRYQELIRKNYEDNFPLKREAGSMNIRLYEWSYQVILPFSIAKSLGLDEVNLDMLKAFCLLKNLNISYDTALKNYKFDHVLGYQGTFLEWTVNELIKREIVPVSAIDADILAQFYTSLERVRAKKRDQ